MALNNQPNIASPDSFYEELIHAQRDLTDEQSEQVNARLVLLLANHIGDIGVLRQAMALARQLDDERLELVGVATPTPLGWSGYA